MPTVYLWSWWGGDNPPPPNLKTKKQLSELGLSPKNAIGVIETSNYDLLLYDPNDPESVKPKRKPTEKQLAALAKARADRLRKLEFHRWWEAWGFIQADEIDAIRWAKEMMAENFVILDTETTDFEGEIVEIAIIDKTGQPLLDTLVKPTEAISEDAIATHGITDEMVANAPTFLEILGEFEEAIASKELIIYNAAFDLARIRQSLEVNGCRKKQIKRPKLKAHCLMEYRAQFVGDWSSYYDNYKWQPLNGGHRALSDCLAALDLLRAMAKTEEYFADCPAPEMLPERYQNVTNRAVQLSQSGE